MKKVVMFSFFIMGLFASVKSDESLPLIDCKTSKGDLRIEIHRDWAPLGADRFVELVQDEFFTDIAFFRCVKRFLTQFGVSDNPSKKHWHNKEIPDDPNLHLGVHKNYVSFAGSGPNSRSTQIFIAFEELDFLGKDPWETPFGVVIQGQKTLDGLYKGYGDIPPFGHGVDQQKIHNRGNKYVRDEFPLTDFIHSCSMVIREGEERPPSEEVVEVVEEGEKEEKEEDVEEVAESTESVTEKETTRRLRTKMSIRTKPSGAKEVKIMKNGEESVTIEVNEEEKVHIEEVVEEEEKDEVGLDENVQIFRAVGFLVVMLLFIAVTLRYFKPPPTVGKAQ